MINILFLIILIEACTELLVKSEIFNPIRKWVFNKKEINVFYKWLDELINCGYCSSVWIAFFFSFLMIEFNIIPILFSNILLTWFILSVITHRLSNILHFIIDRLDRSKVII